MRSVDKLNLISPGGKKTVNYGRVLRKFNRKSFIALTDRNFDETIDDNFDCFSIIMHDDDGDPRGKTKVLIFIVRH